MPSASGFTGITVTRRSDHFVCAGHPEIGVAASSRMGSGAAGRAVQAPVAFGGGW